MPRNNRTPLARYDRFFSFNLVVNNQRGKTYLKKIIDSVCTEKNLTLHNKQYEAFELIILNAIYYNYKPLIISLGNSSIKAESRYNHSGVGIITFKSTYKKLEKKRIIFTRFKSFANVYSKESTVITVDSLKKYCNEYADRIKKYLRRDTELVILKKKVLINGSKKNTKRILCEYNDTEISRASRRFLKEYNKWIAAIPIGFDRTSAKENGLFNMPRYRNWTREQWLPYYIGLYYHQTELRRIFTAPEDYQHNIPRPLPELGGRFYGAFWQHDMPSDFRRYLVIDGESCVELDFRAMNVTMLYLKKLGIPWSSYPYENIPLPNNPDICFPKDVVKPFFTWCINVINRRAAVALLSKELDAGCNRFLKKHKIKLPDYINSMLSSQPEIQEYFFTGEILGHKLQFHDSQIVEAIMKKCMEENIYCYPVHDAVLVKFSHKDVVKDIMVKELCRYFGAEYKPEYIDLLLTEDFIPQAEIG